MLFPPKTNPNVPPRVVITGAGILTSLGHGWRINADGFKTGRTAFRPVSLFDVSRHRVKSAAEVELPPGLPDCHLSPTRLRRLDRGSRLLLHAAIEARDQAGWGPSTGLPLVLGTTSGGMSLGEAYYRQAIRNPARHRQEPTWVMNYQAQVQAGAIAQACGFSGPTTIIANACASGANAVGHAWELIRRGATDRVFAGGYDALSELVFTGFDSLQALSPTRCRPFAADRDGLALGEGAAMVTLETLNSARRRDAQILGEIVGYGAATDIHHLTQPHPRGTAAFASMTAACASAGLRPGQIGYINAHGTGTPLNDAAEAAALNAWAGPDAPGIRVSSTKSCIGHLLGAAGAVEVVICLMALSEGWLPPNAPVGKVDPACEFQLLQKPIEVGTEYALTNSFGFGGANATLILRRWS